MTAYTFCVSRTSASGSLERFGVRYDVGDVDPGREALRVLVSQKYRQADTTSVGVAEYNSSICGPIREEVNVRMTPQQAKELVEAIGRGDIVGTAAAAIEIVAGITTETLEGAQNVVREIDRVIRRIFP